MWRKNWRNCGECPWRTVDRGTPRCSGKPRTPGTRTGWSSVSFGGCRPWPKATFRNAPGLGPLSWPTAQIGAVGRQGSPPRRPQCRPRTRTGKLRTCGTLQSDGTWASLRGGLVSTDSERRFSYSGSGSWASPARKVLVSRTAREGGGLDSVEQSTASSVLASRSRTLTAVALTAAPA